MDGSAACGQRRDQAAGVDPDEPDDFDGPEVLTSSPCLGGLPDTVCGVDDDPESDDEVDDEDVESDFDSDEAATPLLPRLSVR